ncbi:MAG TPA: RES family NAD+ phosphorylase [Acidobacteriaceae bacterium]|nr:RES family NAD+ phosphorylase [Acidobacteriaceae bacterium]
MHSIEKIITVLEHVPLAPHAEPSYRVIADRWRDNPLSAIGSFERGGRYNAPHTFPVLYTADSQMTALLETEALFTTTDGQLRGAPRDPDLVLTLQCSLSRVLDLTVPDLYSHLGTTYDELVSTVPSRFILNARKKLTPTQQLGMACFRSGQISAVKVPSAQNAKGYCLNILIESLVVGERVAILDKTGRLKAEVNGWIPKPLLH